MPSVRESRLYCEVNASFILSKHQVGTTTPGNSVLCLENSGQSHKSGIVSQC